MRPAWGMRMGVEETIEVNGAKRLVKAEGADLSGSSFTDVNLSGASFKNMNFAGLKINNADLRGASIIDSLTTGMTIDGIAVTDLMAAYRALTEKLG